MQDDGVGYHILRSLQDKNVQADLVDLGTDIFGLRAHFKNHSRIIILDAMKGGETPGTVLVFRGPEFRERLEGNIQNAHLLGVIEALDIMRAIDDQLAKAEFFFVGVVAQTIDKGLELTEPVAKAVQKAVNQVGLILANQA